LAAASLARRRARLDGRKDSAITIRGSMMTQKLKVAPMVPIEIVPAAWAGDSIPTLQSNPAAAPKNGTRE